ELEDSRCGHDPDAAFEARVTCKYPRAVAGARLCEKPQGARCEARKEARGAYPSVEELQRQIIIVWTWQASREPEAAKSDDAGVVVLNLIINRLNDGTVSGAEETAIDEHSSNPRRIDVPFAHDLDRA